MKLKILIIILVAIILRVINLDAIPPGVANDELNIAINAQSLLKTGINIPGVVTGVIGKTSGDLAFGIHSELSSYLIIPFIAAFGFNLISIKIPFVLASLGIVILGYFLVKRMFGEKPATVVMACLAVNPWLIFFGRTAYESILSSFFFLLSILLIINLQGWKKNLSLIALIAGFLCYFSAKTLIIPITIVASYASITLNKRHDYKPLVILNLLVIIFVGWYLLILPKTHAGARINELKPSMSSQTVNIKRTASLSNMLALPFENKVIEDLRIRIVASLGELNPTYLFFNGQPETIPSLSIPDHAFMYFIDLPLVILGIIFMAEKYKKQLVILLCFIAVTMVPNFLDLQGSTYSIRTVILFPILSMISAIGIFSIRNKLLKGVIIVAYLISVLNFCYIYFNRLPVERSEAWFLSEKVMSRYVSDELVKKPQTKILLVAEQPKLTFYKYLFYSGSYTNQKQITSLNKNIAEMNYEIGNLKITSNCPENIPSQQNEIIIQSTSSNCPEIHGTDSIKSINDAGDVYIISKDLLCQNLLKNKYPLIKNTKTLKIENLTTEDFCKDYVSYQ